MKDKSFKVLFVIYIIAFLGDLISTLRVGELLKYLEANPVFKFGGLPLITILNIVFAALYYWLYSKGNVNLRFYVVFSLVAIIITRVIAITQNMAVAQNPPTLEQAMAVTQVMKTEAVKKLLFVNVLPFFNGVIAWIFFKQDHDVSRKV